MQIETVCLTEAEIQLIHLSALEVLAKTGVKMPYPAALEVLDGAGASVDSRTGRVKIEAGLVEKCLALVPRKFELHNRDEKRPSMPVPGGPYYGTWANSVRILDPDTGERRPATRDDLVQFVRLADALQYDWMQPLLTPQDVSQETAFLHAWAIALQNTGKHLVGQAPGAAGTKVVLEMCAAVAGGVEQLMEKPFITFDILARPPLMWSDWSLGGMLEAAKYKIPLTLGAGPIGGATGPVTMAGTIVQSHAELLSGIVLAQSASPGIPLAYSSAARVMDMATGSVSMCSPEWFLFRVSLRQMGRFLGMPVYTGGLFTDAKIPDAQSGYEKGISAVAGALGGDIIAGCTLETNKTIDMGDLVIGDEIASMMRRMMRGFQITPETLAVKVIDQVGPGGEFLGHTHTLKHFRQEIWRPRLSDRTSWNSWVDHGRKDAWQRAKEIAKKLLAEHQPYQLPHHQRQDIESILTRIDS